MVGSIAFPSDPVTNGAVSIQSTTFANVAADYGLVPFESAQFYLADKEGIRYFPAKKLPGWTFYQRNDLVGSSANLRNVIGIRVTHLDANHAAFSVANGAYSVPVQDVEISVWNWFPDQRTLSDSSIVTRFKCDGAMKTLSINPEDQTIYTDVGETRSLEEAVGFLLLRAAASAPVLTPALKALAGSHPLA
jgi:hypothetical protein